MTEEQKQLAIFVAKYEVAVEEGRDIFFFFGQAVLTTYAKYYIENEQNKVGERIYDK